MKFCYSVLGVIFLVAICLQASVWNGDARARKNRAYVKMLISVGQDLEEAEEKLVEAGFRLVYEEAITPTVDEGFLRQLVVVGDTLPNGFETLGYAMGASWMPFTNRESAYVSIEADLEGRITGFE